MRNRCDLRHLAWVFLLLTPLSCADPPTEPIPESAPAADLFDGRTAGTITGRVTWSGDLPLVPPLEVRGNHFPPKEVTLRQYRPNPNAPQVDPASRAVAGAVVCLRGIDPRRSRPWDHPLVRIELRGDQFHVCHGERVARAGFVRCRETVELVSHDDTFHAVRARGADFFGLTLPDRDTPARRRLSEPGLVELSSGAGRFWMRAYLFVTEHPYWTLTDAAGRFELPQVPPGRYEVVCWLPNWIVARHERDPESGRISRLFFGPPAEVVRTVTLGPRESVPVNLEVFTAAFGIAQR